MNEIENPLAFRLDSVYRLSWGSCEYDFMAVSFFLVGCRYNLSRRPPFLKSGIRTCYENSNRPIYTKLSIAIEDKMMVGGDCKIFDTDFHFIQFEDRIIGDTNIKSAATVLCEGCLVGTGSTILKGVTIGKRAVIADGSVVSRIVPDDEVWGGNPIHKIRSLVTN